jgi:hypothetical protein
LPVNIEKISRRKDIYGREGYSKIVDEIRRPTKDRRKAIYLQKIECGDDRHIEFRLGYYMIGVKPRMAGRWVWGQFATFITGNDLRAIVNEAETRGWF